MQLSDAIISETQMDMKSELSKVIRNVIAQQTGITEETSMMTNSGRSGALGAMQHGYAMAQSRPSSRSRKSTEALPKVDIDDDMRIIIMDNLMERLSDELQQKALFTAHSDTGNVLNLMKSDTLAKLVGVASDQDGELPNSLD